MGSEEERRNDCRLHFQMTLAKLASVEEPQDRALRQHMSGTFELTASDIGRIYMYRIGGIITRRQFQMRVTLGVNVPAR